MTKTLLALPFLLLAISFSAKADLMFEPFVGYETGSIKDNTAGGTTDLTGMSYGLRLGLKNFGFAIGAEYNGGSLELESTPLTDLTPKHLGAFISYDFPLMLRVYYSYFISADTDISQNGSSSTYQGDGYRLGVGFSLIPFLTINVDYVIRNYDKAEVGGVTTSIDSTAKTTMISFSVPISL